MKLVSGKLSLVKVGCCKSGTDGDTSVVVPEIDSETLALLSLDNWVVVEGKALVI